jgi:hypothetical protein
MTLRRHSFVAFILIAALVSVFFAPLIPAIASGRHHSRPNAALPATISLFHFVTAPSFPPTPAPTTNATRTDNLIALNCVRLC